MMGHREKMINGFEYDAFCSRKYHRRPSMGWGYVKSKFNRRIRRIAKLEVKNATV